MREERVDKHKEILQDIKLRRNAGELKARIQLQHDLKKLEK